MASQQARRDIQGFGQKGKPHHKLHSEPVLKFEGLEFSSGGNLMRQEQGDTQRVIQTSSTDQGGQEQKGSGTKKNTQMHKEEGKGRGKGGIHVQEGGIGTEGRKGPSLEEISQLRATAQQNSMEVLGAAEERYQKAKEKGASALHDAKESASHGLGAAGCYATAKGAQAKDTVTHGVQSRSQYVADKAVAAKDTAIEKGQIAMQSAQQAKDYTVQKAGETKDYAAQKITTGAKSTTHYAGEKATQAKQTAAELSKNAASYVGQKGFEAKDAAVETGKNAVGYAGEVAGSVKDKAAMAGPGAAHYTADKAAASTKATAGAVSSVAGYAGANVVAAKDVVVDAGKSTVEYTADKLAAVTDYVVSAEDSAADYARRKQAEAERQLEGKNSEGERGGGVISVEKKESEEGEERNQLQGQHGRGGVLEAIGETIVEIGKTTKDLVGGGD